MPFTLMLARAALCGFVLLLVCAALGLQALGEALGFITAATIAVGVPVFFAEALGFLNAAARFFFGHRPE